MINAEVLIAEIRAIDPGIPIHIAKRIVDLLNAKIDGLVAEMGLVKEVFVDHEPHPQEVGI